MYAVEANGLTKSYRVFDNPWQRLREVVTRRPHHRSFQALRDVSFSLAHGEALGVIGENGAGKSTLLEILAGVTLATHGTLRVQGRVAAILELGVGFHPDFSGRQNIALTATLLGLTAGEVRLREQSIIDFAELGPFIDQPVKTYSTGMAMRLGFAIATMVDPDVLIVDEALSVGDGYFAKKCVDRMQGLIAGGTTLLFCSHAMYYVSAFCKRALWLRHGEVAAYGPTTEVVRAYEEHLQHKEASAKAAPAGGAARTPERKLARIVEVRRHRVRNAAVGEPTPSGPGDTDAAGALILAPGDGLAIDVEWTSTDPLQGFQVGIGVNRVDEVEILAFATHRAGWQPITGAGRHRLRLLVPQLPLAKGTFKLYVFVLDELGVHVFDQHIVQRAFVVENPGYSFGLIELAHSFALAAPSGATSGHAVATPGLVGARLVD